MIKSVCFARYNQRQEHLTNAYETLIHLLLPEGILDYFELINVLQGADGQLNIYLKEKNLPPAGFEKADIESKGFLPETAIQDFLIRGHKVALRVKRRRWEIKQSGEIITRDWQLVRKGAQMTTEFGTFLKGIFGY